MTPRISILALISAIWLGTTSAEAESYVGFGCAPWDGQTFSVMVDQGKSSLSVNIWQKGFSDLKSGQRTIVIDNRGVGGDVPDATGSAVFRSSSSQPYANVLATIYFRQLDFRVGGNAEGYVQLLDGSKFLFSGAIPSASRCG